jgi:threonine synthase
VGVPLYSSPLKPRIDPSGYKHALRERRASSDPRFASGVWRLLELLPALPAAAVVTLGEGNVPLYASPRGAGYAGIDGLAYLHLGMNPTGSFKDLGMTVAISAAKAAGARGVACASTGNTASSMAAYAARAGLPAYALIPRGRISQAKLAQILDYGAEILEVDGSFDDAFARLSSIEGDLTIVNSTNPYRIEGQKCAAFMLLEARAWRVPDWVFVPGGNLGNSTAIGRGFREALALGLIDRLPRLAVVQAAGAAPFVRAFESDEELIPLVAQTRASAIAVGSPKSWRASLHEVRASGGVVLAVDDDAIDDAKGAIGREGIGCEPASAATLAGLRSLRRSGVVAADADVVAVLTGHVLKDTDASLRIHERFRNGAHAAV